MVNKRFYWGILVMALVFGMLVVGCEKEETIPSEEEITITIKNQMSGPIIKLEISAGSKIMVAEENASIIAAKGSKDYNIKWPIQSNGGFDSCNVKVKVGDDVYSGAGWVGLAGGSNYTPPPRSTTITLKEEIDEEGNPTYGDFRFKRGSW
jgi:hypothetical protein